MEKLRIGIVEDEAIVAENLLMLLENMGYEALEPAHTFAEGLRLIREEEPDLMLLDIMLGEEKTGIDLAREIRKNHHIPLIFLTANSDSIVVNAAKEVRPQAYLVKPFVREEIYTSIEIALANFETLPPPALPEKVLTDTLFVKHRNRYHKVKFADIAIIKSAPPYLELITRDRHKFLIRNSLSSFEADLPPDHFFRIHRQFLINLDQLESINTEDALVAGETVPVSPAKRKILMDLLNLY